MNESVKSGLDGIFRTHQDKNNQVQSLEKEKENREKEFLSAFYAHQNSIIRPAMEAIGKYIEEKGCKYEIDESQDGATHGGRHQGASIAIRFLFGKDSYRPMHEYSSFAVFCEKNVQKARFHENIVAAGRGGQSSPAGEASLDEVTEDLIHTKILRVLTEAIKE
jgi:hypothetical protein